ncbi:PilT protein domain protein [Candidatus Sulfopaludibacter sp. SbA4]|nr:PilT protein domain protein [Candidatus Sulfopaludibacter sp. SbA4]
MKAFFDSSVLVPVFYGDHEHHERSMAVFKKYGKVQACCGAHTLAEVYSSLTRMPGRHRISAEQGILFIENLREKLTVVSLDAEEYWQGLNKYADLGIVGGTIYDAMLGYCALKGKAETIYSWNTRHYQQLGPEIVKRLQTP